LQIDISSRSAGCVKRRTLSLPQWFRDGFRLVLHSPRRFGGSWGILGADLLLRRVCQV